jgi:hypothetical protein
MISIYEREVTGERNILTAIARDPRDRRRIIGEEAVALAGAREFTLNFKEAPDPDDMATPDSILFVQALLNEFLGKTYSRDHALLIVGHPAGWDKKTKSAFVRHLEALRMQMRVLPESQAALIHVRGPVLENHARPEAKNTNTRQTQRILVIDIGSSTTDFTFIEDLKPRNLPLGADFGCRAIDLKMAGLVREAFASQPDMMAILEDDGGFEYLLLACRRAKEAQFSGSPPIILDQRINPAFKPIVGAVWKWLTAIQVPELIAAPGGWLDQLRNLMLQAADELAGNLPEQVVLTGGGSRIPAAGQLCRMVFPTAVILHDPEPSLSVARGLALAGLHEVRVARFRSEIAGLLHASAFVNLCEEGLRSAVSVLLRDFVAQLRAGNAADAGEFTVSLTKLDTSLAAYLSKKVPPVCSSYGVVDGELDLDISLPLPIADIIADDVANYIIAASSTGSMGRFTWWLAKQDWSEGMAERWTEWIARRMSGSAGAAGAGRMIQAEDVMHIAAIIAGAAVTALGARSQEKIASKILALELSPKKIDDLVMQIQAHIKIQLDERISEIEKLIH